MNGIVVTLVVGCLAGLGTWAMLRDNAAERAARRLLATDCVCCHCQRVPVFAPGAVCNQCRRAGDVTTYQLAAVAVFVRRCVTCERQRAPDGEALCRACRADFEHELTRWEFMA